MSDHTRAARRFLAALENLDAAAVAPLVADDVVQVLPFGAAGDTEPGAVFDGRDAVLQVQRVIVEAFSLVAFHDVRVTEGVDGRTVFVEASGHRVQAGTGRVYDNVYLLKFEFYDGLIRRITEYSNPVAFALFFGRPIGQPDAAARD